MNKWFEYVEQNKPCYGTESRYHTHVMEERAGLFHCIPDDLSVTELEYSNLIHALIIAEKPLLSIELGTSIGITTLAMAAACEFNDYGRVVSVDNRLCASARSLINACSLWNFVRFVERDSLQYLVEMTENPNFILLDTTLPLRSKELDYLLWSRNLRNCTIVLHDTSPLRFKEEGNPDAYNQELQDSLSLAESYQKQRLDFPLSRGLTVFRI